MVVMMYGDGIGRGNGQRGKVIWYFVVLMEWRGYWLVGSEWLN